MYGNYGGGMQDQNSKEFELGYENVAYQNYGQDPYNYDYQYGQEVNFQFSDGYQENDNLHQQYDGQITQMNNFINTPVAQNDPQPSGGRLLRKGLLSSSTKSIKEIQPANPQISHQLSLEPSQKQTNIFSSDSIPQIVRPEIKQSAQIPSQPDFQFMEPQETPQQSLNSQSINNLQVFEGQSDMQSQSQQPSQSQKMSVPVKLSNKLLKSINAEKQNKIEQKTVQPVIQEQPVAPIPVQMNSQPELPENLYNPPPKPQYPDLFQQRKGLIESNFSNSLERSMNNFKHIFTNEFQTILRQCQSQNSVNSLMNIDEYCESLKNDVASLISNFDPSSDSFVNNNSNVARKVTVAIDECTKPVSQILAEASSRNFLAVDRHISELRQLQEELDNLHNVFRGTGDNIIKELQREGSNASSIRDAEQLRYNSLEQKMRSLKIKRTELETKLNRQKLDRESLERSLKQFEKNKREWEEVTLPYLYDEGGALRQKIMNELNEIKSDIENFSSFDDVVDSIDEGLQSVKEESENLRSEVFELQLMNNSIMAKMRDSQLMSQYQSQRSRMMNNSNYQNPQGNSSFGFTNSVTGFSQFSGIGNAYDNQQRTFVAHETPFIREAREKLDVFRRQRNQAMKEVQDQFS